MSKIKKVCGVLDGTKICFREDDHMHGETKPIWFYPAGILDAIAEYMESHSDFRAHRAFKEAREAVVE